MTEEETLEALQKRWEISVKTLSMALEKEVAEGVLNSIREKVTDSYLELIGTTGNEPARPDFADQIFDELFGVDEEGLAFPPKPHRKPSTPPSRFTRLTPAKKKPKSKPSVSPKRKKSVKKSVKKAKNCRVKRGQSRKKSKAKKKRK